VEFEQIVISAIRIEQTVISCDPHTIDNTVLNVFLFCFAVLIYNIEQTIISCDPHWTSRYFLRSAINNTVLNVFLFCFAVLTYNIWSDDAAPGISASPSEDNMRYFNVMILGPTQSPYEGSDDTNHLVLHLEMSMCLSLLEMGN